MALIAEMHYNVPGTPEFRSFDCHGSTWDRLLSLMKQYGWKPRGAQVNQFSWDPSRPHTDSYEPMDYLRGSTIVGPDDAADMAAALEKALADMRSRKLAPRKESKPLLLSDSMTVEQFRAINRDLDEGLLNEFQAFVRKGPFRVNWDD